MSTGHAILDDLAELIGWHRDQHQNHITEREKLMQFLADMEKAVASLISDRQASDTRATTAEAEVATLKAQIAADETTLKGLLDTVNAEVTAETPADPAPAPAAPVVTTVGAATVTVDPSAGTTVHADPTTGVTTTVPLSGGTPTAVDSTGAAVAPDPAAVSAATSAAAAAGVSVPGA